jgi:hypothetical protein
MSSITPAPAADYRLGASGRIELSDEGQAVVHTFREAEAAYDTLEHSWAGAYLAGLFLQHPWLQSLRITLSASSEYDDQGGSYRSISNSVTSVEAVPGATLPEDLTDDGQFDQTTAISAIEADLDDNDHSLYCAIDDSPNDYTDRVLALNRDAIGKLLECMPISGSLAYQALYPAPAEDVAP